MLIVLGLYALVIWLLFSKLRILPWNRFWKWTVYLCGFVIALVVIGALNHLTPRGAVSVQGPVIEITPNVSGTVVEVPVSPNAPVAKGDILFRIDDTPFAAEVARLEAALVEAQAAEERLYTDLEASEAEIERLEAQLKFGIERRDDIVELANRGASTEFQMQEAVSTIEQTEASLRAAQSNRAGIESRIAAKVDGTDSSVAQAEQALVSARWNLEQTEVHAPSNGIVTFLALRPGNRVTSFRSALGFAPDDERVLAATFPQTSAHGVKAGDEVLVALRALPGSHFTTTVTAVATATGEGALAATGTLPTLRQLTGATGYVARLELPDDLPDIATRLGTSGTAMRITENAGPIEPLARVIFWIGKMMNYI